MRLAGAQDIGIRLLRPVYIIRIITLSGQETVILFTPDLGTDTGYFCSVWHINLL